MIELAREDVLDRLRGCWLGQQIGATLGLPLDGRPAPAALRFYDPIPGQASASMEIDFQLAWLSLLRDQGVKNLGPDDLAGQWQRHLEYPYDELGWAAWNLRRKLLPPLSGAFNNWFKTSSAGMGRSLLWAMVAPGAPQIAAGLAWQDAVIDHAEEGVWAAMLWAAVGSGAFATQDVGELMEIGLAMIPSTSRTAGAVRAARDRFRISGTPLQTRDAIFNASGSSNFTDAAQNSGLIAMGLLYGKGDFGGMVTTAVNGGLNARVNGTIAGGIAGILRSRIGIPREWTDPIGDVVIYGWGLKGLEVDRTTTELAAHTILVAEAMLAERGAEVAIVDLPEPEEPAPVAAIAQVEPPAPFDSSQPSGAPEGRGNFLEIDPLPAGAPGSAGSPEPAAPAVSSEEAAPAALTESALAPAEERAGISDTAAIADQLPTDSAYSAGSSDSPDSVDSADASESVASADTSDSADSAASADAPDSASPGELPATPDLADIFQPTVLAAPSPPPAPRPLAALRANDRAKEVLVRSPMTAICEVGSFEFTVDYGEHGPVLMPGIATNFTVAVRNLGEEDFVGGIALNTPQGWQVAVPGAQAQRQMIAKGRMARFGFVVRSPQEAPLTGTNRVEIVLAPEGGGASTSCEIAFLGGSCWWITGPFANNDQQGYDRTFEVEDKPGLEHQYLARNGGMVGWQRMAFRENVIGLEPFFGAIPGVAYARTVLRFPVQTDARLVIHSSDGVHVWLNGQRIFRRHAHEPFRPTVSQSRNQLDVTFKPGANELMLKIIRCRDPLQLAFIVTDRSGVPLEDLGNTKWETS